MNNDALFDCIKQAFDKAFAKSTFFGNPTYEPPKRPKSIEKKQKLFRKLRANGVEPKEAYKVAKYNPKFLPKPKNSPRKYVRKGTQ